MFFRGQIIGKYKILSTIGSGGFDVRALVAWAAVGIPLAWGIWITLQKALVLFQ